MFSKALFKQSCKANGTMWIIITFATCFMLACVMLISGNGNIGTVKNSIQDTIITKEVDAQLHSRALSSYDNSLNGMEKFDTLFSENATDTFSYLYWLSKMPSSDNYENLTTYTYAMNIWQKAEPEMKTSAGNEYRALILNWQGAMPSKDNYENLSDYSLALDDWNDQSPATQEGAAVTAYTFACKDLQSYVLEGAATLGYKEESLEAQEILGSVMYVLNPNGMFNDFYIESGENVPEDYDILSLLEHIATGDLIDYCSSEDRVEYRCDRCADCSAIFIAGNMVKSENQEALINALSAYGVSKEKYETFGYTYDSIKHMSKTAIVTYQGRLKYELVSLKEDFIEGKLTNEEYQSTVIAKMNELRSDISSSFLTTLPDAVADAMEEIGQMDLYTLVVGSIFYKLAGLLLPIIYMIMVSNNLIAGQVDSGSMAYVLSTSTKRGTVVFTQAVFLFGSLLCMFCCTTVTSCICLASITEEVALTYKNLILLNVGAFLVLFALSGLCFFTSCLFDRSKHSMSLGGGLSIFALVAAMLGLFGSPVIPSVVRLNALNNFNYATIISLFDVISIMDGTSVFIWKFAILAALGVVGYMVGSVIFTKKDLPL